LDRVETNRIRGGMCLVYLDGLPLKASKIKKRIKKWGEEFGLEHWGWIKDYLELQKEIHSSGDDEDEEGDEESKDQYTPSDKYLGSLTAGRPVFAHPGEKEVSGSGTVIPEPTALRLYRFILRPWRSQRGFWL